MKKHIILFLLFVCTCSLQAQVVRGLRIGYIDMEYILQNAPDYTEAKNQLEQKAQLWKQEIGTKTAAIEKLKESLKTERVLLTKELIEEREEEIAFQEKELMDFQQKRFGPTGDLIVQKAVLVKPIQDQVFTAVQDIATQKKYDFVFDKSSDLTMIFAAKQFDISDQVIRKLSRTSKRSQLSKKELKEEAIKEYKEDVEDANSDFAIRKKMLDDKKAARDSLVNVRKEARDKILADRKAAADAKRADAAAKRQEAIDKKNGVTKPSTPANKNTETPNEKPATEAKPKAATEKEKRDKIIADKKEVADAKRADAAAKRADAAAKRQEAIDKKNGVTKPTTPANKNAETPNEKPTTEPASGAANKPATEATPKADTEKEAQRKLMLEAKKKEMDDRKKALADKKAKTIKDREDAKKAKEAGTTPPPK